MPIQQLDQATIGKISAGEVVERPASAVKELVENALDAGATSVRVDIAGGGTDRIEVSDNGQGMSVDELGMAFSRHATSKLRQFTDLEELQTLGFRGEALPSIAAVSTVQVRSRTPNQPAGSVISSEFGSLGPSRTVSCDLGTTVSVRDLFLNVPARRKFLKRPATETAAINRVVEAYALAYPNVAVQLIVDGRKSFSTPGNGELIDAAIAVLGADVGNAATPAAALDSTSRVTGVEVNGWLGAPAVHRANRQGIVFFVNGRWIQHRSLSYALEDAYHTLLMVGRHPYAVLHIRVDPAVVDVNVHPTKAEVKFIDERSVGRAVARVAHATLSSMPSPEVPAVNFDGPPAARSFSQNALGGSSSMSNPALIRTPAGNNGSGDDVATTPELPALRVLGQVSASYIIAEGPEGLYLIDQHAAHERVLYEQFQRQMASDAVEQQPMLDPLVLELTDEHLNIVSKSSDELASLGFEIEPFGDNAVIVRAVPVSAVGVDISERLQLVLDELLEGGEGDSWLDSVAISLACHTSIRAGQSLSLSEMRELIEQLERTNQPRACGHGRPTMLRLSQSDLEKQFARK